MAEETATTTYSRQSGKWIPTHRGSKAGESFATDTEKKEAEDWTAYKIEKKLSFAAQKKDHPGFTEWRKKRAARSGQAAAVK